MKAKTNECDREIGRLTARRRVIASDVGQRANDGQLGGAVLFVLFVEVAMAP